MAVSVVIIIVSSAIAWGHSIRKQSRNRDENVSLENAQKTISGNNFTGLTFAIPALGRSKKSTRVKGALAVYLTKLKRGGC